jgi:hypothetical protein
MSKPPLMREPDFSAAPPTPSVAAAALFIDETYEPTSATRATETVRFATRYAPVSYAARL